MKLRNLILGIILCNLILSVSGTLPTRADAGPPPAPKGVGISPGEETTMVQMVSERVEIEVTGEWGVYHYQEFSNSTVLQYSGYEAIVNASFTMQNQGDIEESIAVHFPLGHESDDLIQDFRVFVGGQELDWTYADYSYSDFTWARFDVTFPIEKNVVIKVRYTMYHPPRGHFEPEFNYILETGAGWYDSIGEADIILRLPYQANRINVIEYPPGAEFVGSEVRWHYEVLEPTTEDNWRVVLLWPDDWKTYIEAKKDLDKHPDDPDLLVEYAWALIDLSVFEGRDINVYDERSDMFAEAKQSLNRAASLGANSADFHSRIAYTYFREYLEQGGDPERIDTDSPQMQFILDHIYKAIQIDPDNKLAWSLFDSVNYGASPLPTPLGPTEAFTRTATATRTQTLTPTSRALVELIATDLSTLPTFTSTPTPTRTFTSPPPTPEPHTPRPTSTPSPTATKQPEVAGDNNAWLVGAIALVALIGGGFVWVWVEKQKA